MSIDEESNQPLTRCCAVHADWPTLSAHLRAEFAELPAEVIAEELIKARRAVEMFGVDAPDGLPVAELIVRHRLLITTGRMPDIAKLDPQTHVRGYADPQFSPRDTCQVLDISADDEGATDRAPGALFSG